MKSKEIKEYVEQGYLQINVLFEVVGNPKEHVENMIKKVIEGVKSNKDIKIIEEDYGEPDDAGDGLWGTFCETEMLVKNVHTLAWLAFNFSPASIEIKKPEELTLNDKQLTDFIGDLLAQLHQNNMNTIKAKSETKGVLKNFNALVRNAVLLSLKENDKTAKEIGQSIGIEEKGIIPVLNAMIKEKTVAPKEDKYTRIK